MTDPLAQALCSLGLPAIARRGHLARLGILMYHGVVERPLEPFCWHQLSADRFRRQMEWIAPRYAVLPLSEALTRLESGTLPPRAMAITFDDGYLNNRTVAAPVLEALRLPATIFLVTGTVGTDEVVWPDRLWLAFSRTRALRAHHPELGLHQAPLSTLEDRGRAFSTAFRSLRALDRATKDRRLEALLSDLGEPAPGDPGPFRALGWSDVRSLTRTGLFEFGGHTVRHEILSRLADADVEASIARSHEEVVERTGVPPAAFAYPNGRAEDFDERSKAVVAAIGLRHALSTIEGWNDRSTDRLALRRWSVGADLSFARFRLLVSGALGLLRRPTAS